MTNEYTKYLKSEKWAEIKKRLFKKRGKKCEKCGKINILHIHHLTYRNIFNEKDEDLIILCNLCHEKAHGIKKPVVKTGKIKSKKHKPETYFKKILDKQKIRMSTNKKNRY